MKTALKLLNPRLFAEPAYVEDVRKSVAVIATPFNRYLRGEKPDTTNDSIAHVAASYCSALNVPFIGQWEQTSILRRAGAIVHEFPSKDGQWVQTHQLMSWIRDELDRMGTKRRDVVLVGHPHHVRRCAILAIHHGLIPHVPADCAKIPYDPTDRPGDQWWCKSAIRYIPWEYMLARPKLILDDLRGVL